MSECILKHPQPELVFRSTAGQPLSNYKMAHVLRASAFWALLPSRSASSSSSPASCLSPPFSLRPFVGCLAWLRCPISVTGACALPSFRLPRGSVTAPCACKRKSAHRMMSTSHPDSITLSMTDSARNRLRSATNALLRSIQVMSTAPRPRSPKRPAQHKQRAERMFPAPVLQGYI